MTQERVVLVTGASSGIGLATANLLAERGFRVFGTARKPVVSNARAGMVEMLQLDVRDEESVRFCVRTVLERAGRIDAIVNNAGYTLVGSSEETSLDEARELFETNFFGVLRMNREVLPIFRAQQSGRIAIIGSVLGFLPAPYQGIYAASKHALEGYAESLDHEVRQFGIHVSVIEPGFTQTRLADSGRLVGQTLEAYDQDRKRVLGALQDGIAKGGDPVQVASVVLEALTSHSPRVRYPAGSQARFLSRARKFAPSGFFGRRLRKQFRLENV